MSQRTDLFEAPSHRPAPIGLDRYRPWFTAAALYNAAWGTSVVLAPRWVFDVIGMPPPDGLPMWQVVGMMVLVFAPAYWWAARDPWAHRHLIVIGTAGKVLGLLGFTLAAADGQLPWSFGLVVLTNDLIWLPAFTAFLVRAASITGWWRLLQGR